jgi:hypothetical protein
MQDTEPKSRRQSDCALSDLAAETKSHPNPRAARPVRDPPMTVALVDRDSGNDEPDGLKVNSAGMAVAALARTPFQRRSRLRGQNRPRRVCRRFAIRLANRRYLGRKRRWRREHRSNYTRS